MTKKHTTAEYHRNSKQIRAGVKRLYAEGSAPNCWRCGVPIEEGVPYDVGHIAFGGGEGLDNLAPEHRSKTGLCPGNRNLGGKRGARIVNARKPGASATFAPLPWMSMGFLRLTAYLSPPFGSTHLSPSVT